MTHCGALRIDHVMGLLRLWWVPQGDTAVDGAFVSYPVDDLLAILSLESQRQQCMVIGEDLGTVPDEIVAKLRDNGVYSTKYFILNVPRTAVLFTARLSGAGDDHLLYPRHADPVWLLAGR